MPQASSQSTTIQRYPLERRKILKKFCVAMIAFTILLGIISGSILVYLLISGRGIGAILLVSLAVYITIILLELWYQTEYYNRYFYDLEPDILAIKKGVITPRETMLPYEKIQDVYMDQDLFDRIFDLYDVHVSTATHLSGEEAHIDGVNRQNAEKLRALILDKIKKKNG
jgi:putative membrane protein